MLSALAGMFSVGASGNYATLTAAIVDIQTQSLGGAVVLELQAGDSSARETFPLVFSNLSTTATNKLTVRPEARATGLVISSADMYRRLREPLD